MSNQLTQACIRKELDNLVGRRVVRAGLMAGIVVITFGKSQLEISRSGKLIEVGEYALHIQCAWRLVRDSEIVVGFADWVVERSAEGDDEDEEAVDEAVVEEEDESQGVYDRLTKALSESPRVIELVHVRGGGFSLALEGGLYLETFPSLSESDPDDEFWRLLRCLESTPHFVVRPSGASLEM
jgi:hypothetical protein